MSLSVAIQMDPIETIDIDGDSTFALALGPDGGFVPFEVEQLALRGFLPTALPAGPAGLHPLRTESALSALWAQLDLLRHKG